MSAQTSQHKFLRQHKHVQHKRSEAQITKRHLAEDHSEPPEYSIKALLKLKVHKECFIMALWSFSFASVKQYSSKASKSASLELSYGS